jgi:hypothetical protein
VSKDIIGQRGEDLFRVAIGKWCDGKPWFDKRFLGGKAEALDFEVTLRDSAVFQANFFVQVKATAKPKRYAGTGKRRRILVTLKPHNARKLGRMRVPAYVVGIDIFSGGAYIRNVPAGTRRGFNGISTRRPLNCKAIKKLWDEVEKFWKARPQGMTTSQFE